MENKDRMFTGDLYLPNDAAITEEQNACLELLYTCLLYTSDAADE